MTSIFRVQYYRDGQWKGSNSSAVPGPFKSESERLAKRLSGMNELTYRVVKRVQGRIIVVSEWQGGHKLTQDDSE